jgi:hypothetical protein
MADEADLRCKVEFKSDDLVCYTDTYKRKPIEEKVDPAGLAWRTIAVLAKWVRDHDALVRRTELEVLGSHLYGLLFAGKVGEGFTDSYDAFKAAGYAGQVRLELCFHPKAEALAQLPWEFLYLPGRPGGFFLAGENSGLVLTRLVPRDPAIQPVQAAHRPRVLVAACHLVPGARSQVEQIKSTISSLGTPGDVEELPPLDDPSIEQLTKAVKDGEPHVLHLIAHGKPGGLVMKVEVDPAEAIINAAEGKPPPEESEVVDASMIRSMFDQHRPHLVVLHACDGDAPRSLPATDDAPAFTLLFSTARDIAYAGVPAVVAMQYPILVDHAMIFVKEFYAALAHGKTVSDATKEGRRKLANTRQAGAVRQNWATRLFGAPVVYVQEDVRLIAEPELVRPSRRDMMSGAAVGVGVGLTRRPEGPGGSRDLPSPARRRRRCSNCGTGNNPARSDCWSCHASLRICFYCRQEYEDLQADECSRCGEPLWLDAEVGGVYAGVGGTAGGGGSDGTVVGVGGVG